MDYFAHQNKPRNFRSRTATLGLLSIDKYDEKKQAMDLKPKVTEAFEQSKKRYGTVDVDKIKRLLRIGIVREVSMIEGRKKAQNF